MNSEIIIKITPAGSSIESGKKEKADSLPKPESGMGRADDYAEVSNASVPSPEDSFGLGRERIGMQGAPAPAEVQSSSAQANEVPEPVEIGEIESLGKADSTNPPEPE